MPTPNRAIYIPYNENPMKGFIMEQKSWISRKIEKFGKWCDKNRGYILVLGTGATIYVGLQIANRLDQIEDRLELIQKTTNYKVLI